MTRATPDGRDDTTVRMTHRWAIGTTRPALPGRSSVVGMAIAAALLVAPVGQAATPSPGASGPDGDMLSSSGTTVSPLTPRADAEPALPTTAPVTPQPEGPRWPLFADAEQKVGSGTLAVDDQDGIHIAYVDSIPLADGPQAHYAYCPASAACGAGEGWVGTELGEDVLGVMLATTGDGHPRLLIQQEGRVLEGGKDYHFAACDTACDQPDGWQTGYVTSTWGTELNDVFLGEKTRRAFALDHEGRPGFVFYDRDYFHAEPDHLGGFYTWCDADCTGGTPTAPTWQEAYIGGGEPYDTDIYSLPALAYTSDGRPRMVVEVTTGEAGRARNGIIYKACDAACDRPGSWTHTRIAERGYESDVSWDLALDANDQPHVAFYQGSLEDSGGNRLFHLTCTDACDDPAGWTSLDLGLGRGEGESPDIELQADGRPAISYLHSGGSAVHLARCVDDCSRPDGWRATILDTDVDLENDYPVARPFTCDAGIWDAESTRLGFDSAGRMRTDLRRCISGPLPVRGPGAPERPAVLPVPPDPPGGAHPHLGRGLLSAPGGARTSVAPTRHLDLPRGVTPGDLR